MIIHALNMWRHYLLGRRVVLMSDQSGLRYLFDQSKLNSSQARWLATISEFNFDIGYIKGNESRVTNALSIRVQENSHSSYKFIWDRLIGSDLAGKRT